MTRILRTLFLTASLFIAASTASAFAQTPSDIESILKLSQGVSKLFNAAQQADQAAQAEDESIAVEIEDETLPVPKNVGVLLRTPSLKTLDDAVGKFFQQTSGEGFSVLGALRLTNYRRVLATIDDDSELAIMAFCDSVPPQFAVVLPVAEKNFAKFVDALSNTAPADVRNAAIGTDGKTANVALNFGSDVVMVVRQIDPSYVAIVQASAADLLDNFSEENLVKDWSEELPPSLNSAALTLEATPLGLRQLTEGSRPVWKEVTNVLYDLEQSLKDMEVEANLVEIREYIRQNLDSVRIDAAIDDFGVYLSTQTRPVRGSVGEKRIASYGPLPPINSEADRFFEVLPDVEAPLSGQSTIAPLLAKTLPKPFNRLRYVEYSLNLPLESELAAESWQFYLEVDDSEEFVKEMIIPKAREIGSYIGAKQVEDVGSQIFGAIAERRLERQSGRRRPPRNLANPQEAAARGAALGNLLGGAIGADSGEQTAMKKYRFDDFTMYISDLETYTRQKNLMRAEQAGQVVESNSQLLFDRDRPLLSALDVLMANVQNGENLQSSLLRSANAQAEQVDNSPLFTRKSNIVVLDKRHLLIGLGNQELLHYAANNWKSLSNPRINYLSMTKTQDEIPYLQKLCQQIPNLRDSKFVSAIRIDLASGQAYYRWIAENYLRNAPQLDMPDFPADMPKALVVSTEADLAECVRVVAPNKTVADAFKTFAGGKTPLQLILQSNAKPDANADKTSEEEDLDDVFDE